MAPPNKSKDLDEQKARISRGLFVPGNRLGNIGRCQAGYPIAWLCCTNRVKGFMS